MQNTKVKSDQWVLTRGPARSYLAALVVVYASATICSDASAQRGVGVAIGVHAADVEIPRNVRIDPQPLEDRVACEVRFLSQAGELNDEQRESLREKAEAAATRLHGLFRAPGTVRRLVRKTAIVDGRKHLVLEEVDETPDELLRHTLIPLLAEISPAAKLSSKQLAELLKGKAGNALILAVASKDKEVRPVEIVRGDVDVPPMMPDGVAAAAQAHLRLRAQPGEREERPLPARADLDAVREAIEREVRFIARAGGLAHEESELLAQEGAKAITRRRGPLAVEGGRAVRRHMIVVNGRKVLGAEESETLEQLARRELTQALKDLNGEAWKKFDDERKRREERRHKLDVLTQIAALDEALLLTAEQRNEFCNLLSTRWFELCHGPASGDAHLDVVQLCMSATQAMNEFSIPQVELEAVLRPSQIAAFEAVQSPSKLEIVTARPVRQDGALPVQANIRGNGGGPDRVLFVAPEAARGLVRQGLPLEEQRSRLESLLERLVEDADACAVLDDEQKQKLRLAGKLDLDHYYQKEAELEKPLPDRVLVAATREIAGNKVQLPPILNDPSSSFQKALRSRLSAEQREKLATAERERVRSREGVLLQAFTVALAEQAALTDDQIEPLQNLLADRLCDSTDADVISEWRRTMLERLAQLRPEDMEPLLDDWQRPAARDYIRQVAEAARKASAESEQAE